MRKKNEQIRSTQKKSHTHLISITVCASRALNAINEDVVCLVYYFYAPREQKKTKQIKTIILGFRVRFGRIQMQIRKHFVFSALETLKNL